MTKPIKAIAFDVFGTVLDWRSTIAEEGKRILGGDLQREHFVDERR